MSRQRSPAPRRRGRPPVVDRERILSTVLKMDLRAVTMRDLARLLRVTDAALYYHFPSRDSLLEAVVDRIALSLRLPPLDVGWAAWLHQLATSVRALLRSHPGTAEVMSRLGPTTPSQMRVIDASLEVLERDGFPAKEAALAHSLVVGYAVSVVRREDDFSALDPMADVARNIHRAVESTGAPPRVVQFARTRLTTSSDELFGHGLDCIIAGLGAARGSPAPRRR